MSPVHIDELNPETRARVIRQIGETEGTTGLAILEDNNHSSTYSPAEMRARSILSRIDSISAKLKTLEDDIRLLWADFDNLKAGETILGCATKKEFCEKKLHRHPRTIQYLLAGQSNPADRPHADRSELSSPPLAPKPSPEPSEVSRRRDTLAAPEPAPIIDAEFVDAPEPVENPDADIEDAVLALPDSPELDEAVQNPPEVSVKKRRPAKPDAKTESRLQKVQREWASVSNPAIGRITITASNVGSDVETSLGRFDLLLSGVSKPMLDTLRAVLPNLSKESFDRLRKLLA